MQSTFDFTCLQIFVWKLAFDTFGGKLLPTLWKNFRSRKIQANKNKLWIIVV